MNRISKLIDFNENEVVIKKQFLNIASVIIGKEYEVDKVYAPILTEMLRYFTGNEGLDLNKGIYLHGTYGSGKTVLMASIRRFLATYFPFNANGFLSVSLEKIIEDYKSDGNIAKYSYGINDNPINLCIDEFGKEMTEKIYGTSADSIIKSLFMVRYELFGRGKLTHVTSNFSPEELNVEPILKDRMAEMFNFIEIKGESFRK
jgi:predicted ATPase